MTARHKILIFGASYGSLLGVKLALAGHDVVMACLPAEVEAFNRDGARIRMPVKGGRMVEVDSRRAKGSLAAAAPATVDPTGFDLVVLAMQEPQYRSAGVREMLTAVIRAKKPCMSIMNMPPLPYLARLPGLSVADYRHCYADATVWDAFDPSLMTLCSPDPQAFRPPEEPVNVLQVTLPTNFKSARFVSDAHTAILTRLQADVEAVRYDDGAGAVELPVKLKVHESVFVPLAKWCMLLTGNYRCVQKGDPRSIRDAVHTDPAASKAMYDWVFALCRALGAAESDLVPFEKYAQAASGLQKPSSAARALAAGAQNIERVDRLVQTIAAKRGLKSPVIDEIVALVDSKLEGNRRAAA